MKPYTPQIEQDMRKFYDTLSEKDKRRYAAMEALRLGHGGIEYMSKVLGISRKTISQGIKEFKALPNTGYDARTRKPGGGRKPYEEIIEDLDEKFLDVLKDNTAGDPMKEHVKWTNLSHQQIADRLRERHGIVVSRKLIQKLLHKHNYRRRKAQKTKTMKTVENRNEQFENIARLKSEYLAAGWPVISVDTKKKEYLGNFYREGYLYTQGVIETYDHDFNSFAEGVVIPHGIYDLARNTCYINIGTSRDTSEFVCDCIRNWWVNQGTTGLSACAFLTAFVR